MAAAAAVGEQGGGAGAAAGEEQGGGACGGGRGGEGRWRCGRRRERMMGSGLADWVICALRLYARGGMGNGMGLGLLG
jgi:hypothetical protein